MNPPRYSVVMPAHNKGPHLRRSVGSALGQSEADFELIVIDDGSTDDGPRQLTTFDDPRMRVLHRAGPGPGASPARNLGVAEARGTWLAFLDADDEWHPDFLRTVSETRNAFPGACMVSTGWIKKEPGGGCFENAYYREHRGRGPHAYGPAEYLAGAARGAIPVWTSVAAVHRATLVGCGGFPEGEHALRGEDEDTWLRVMLEGGQAAWAPLLGATYHRDAVNRITRKAVPTLSRIPLLETLDARLAVETDGAVRSALETYRRTVRRRARRDAAEQRLMNAAACVLGEARVNRLLERHFNRRARRAKDAAVQSDRQTPVTLVISSLLCGGAERVAAGMADYWSRRGRPVHLVTLFTRDLDFYGLPDTVRRTELGLTQERSGPFAALGVLRKLRDLLRHDETPVVIGYMTRVNLLVLLAARGLGKRVIVTEHNHPYEYRIGRLASLGRRLLYPRADALTVLTRDVDEAWARPLMPEGRSAVVPNFVHLPETSGTEAPKLDLPPRYLVAAGRLVPQKGFDLLIEAYAHVHRRFPDTHLVILGEGPERARLEWQSAECLPAGAVLLPGTVHDVRPVFETALVFVFSSRFEGFGNVLVEAMSCGAPVVSFDCPSGPSDIIRDGVDGLLVPAENTRAMAEAICELLDDPARRQAMGEAAKNGAGDFSMDRVMPRWDALVEQVLRGTQV